MWWGEQTELAMQNFAVSGEVFPLAVIHEIAAIKAAAAIVNSELGVIHLPDALLQCVVEVSEEIAAGRFDSEFPIDVFQTGSGTSSNMNVNEVIAAMANDRVRGRASEEYGRLQLHPNDHINASQSSNDVVPTAVHISVARLIHERLIPSLGVLSNALRTGALRFEDVVKIGRTHLMDAVPVTLGQEFAGMARAVELGVERIQNSMVRLMELPLGGTATGTGLNAPHEFAGRVIEIIRRRTGLEFREAQDHFEAQGGRDALVEVSAMCRSVAISLYKIANDIRWMASGPMGGLQEVRLRSLQAGSSIMAGKTNPVIAEVVCQVVAQVIGNDAAVAFAGASGNFEMNVMVPVIARNVLWSVSLLAEAASSFADKCIDGLEPNLADMRDTVSRSPMLSTALTTALGYDAVRKIVHEAEASGRTIQQVVAEQGLLDSETLARLTDPLNLAHPGRAIPLAVGPAEGSSV